VLRKYIWLRAMAVFLIVILMSSNLPHVFAVDSSDTTSTEKAAVPTRHWPGFWDSNLCLHGFWE